MMNPKKISLGKMPLPDGRLVMATHSGQPYVNQAIKSYDGVLYIAMKCSYLEHDRSQMPHWVLRVLDMRMHPADRRTTCAGPVFFHASNPLPKDACSGEPTFSGVVNVSPTFEVLTYRFFSQLYGTFTDAQLSAMLNLAPYTLDRRGKKTAHVATAL